MISDKIKPLYIKVFLSIVYTVGVFGMLLKPELFVPLTPINLLITCLLLLAFYPFKEKDFILITPEEFNEIPDGEGPLR